MLRVTCQRIDTHFQLPHLSTAHPGHFALCSPNMKAIQEINMSHALLSSTAVTAIVGILPSLSPIEGINTKVLLCEARLAVSKQQQDVVLHARGNSIPDGLVDERCKAGGPCQLHQWRNAPVAPQNLLQTLAWLAARQEGEHVAVMCTCCKHM